MIWIAYSFLTALFESIKDVLGKKSLIKGNEYIVAWALRIYSIPFLLPLLLITDSVSVKNPIAFGLALLMGGTLNLITTILYMKAIKASELSVTIPMITFTPLFLLVTSPIIVGEVPPLSGIFGITLIVLGSYLLNFSKSGRHPLPKKCIGICHTQEDDKKRVFFARFWEVLVKKQKRLLAPFKAIISEKGPRLMLIVAFIWSINANIDKVGIQNSSVVFWAISINVFNIIGMLPLVWLLAGDQISQLWKNKQVLFPMGFVDALKYFFQLSALQLTLVAYVIAIKRTSALICVVLGVLIFKESGFKERFIGTLIMLLGVLAITLL